MFHVIASSQLSIRVMGGIVLLNTRRNLGKRCEVQSRAKVKRQKIIRARIPASRASVRTCNMHDVLQSDWTVRPRCRYNAAGLAA
jgi:hypothetical protein